MHERISGGLIREYELSARGPTGAEARFTSREPNRNGKGGNPTGQFSLGRLVPGRWTLHVTAPGYRGGERVLDVPAAATPGEVSRGEVRIELEPG